STKVNDELTQARKRQAKPSHKQGPSGFKSGNYLKNRLARGQLEHILATNPAVIFLEKPFRDGSELRSIYVSTSVVSLLGFEAESFLGDSGSRFWESRVHPDDLPQYRAEIPVLWRDGHHTFEFRFLHKDGTYRWIREEQRVTRRDAEGKPQEAVGYESDITMQKSVEEELRATRKQIEDVVVSNPAAIYTAKPRLDLSDFDATYISKSFTSLTGFKPEEFFGHSAEFFVTRIHPDDLRHYYSEIPKLWKNGHHTFEYRFRHKDGTYRWIREVSKVVSDDDGTPVEVNGYWVDFTERKQMDQRLQYIVESNPAVLYIGKPLPDRSDFTATYISRNIVSLLGFEADELTGSMGAAFWETRIPPEDFRKYRAEIPLLWRDGLHAFEYRFLHKDGVYRWIREEERLIREADGQLEDVIGYWTDVTEHKLLEEELLKSQRIAAIGEITRMVGHDLRNPLQGIAGATGVLKKHLGNSADETITEMLDVLEKDVAYSNRIITDLLDYSKRIQIVPMELNMKSMIEQSIQMVPNPNGIIVDNQTEDLRIKVDPQIQRVFVNLIKNAYDAMPNGGRLEIKSEASNETIEISLCDTGGGITLEVIQKLWKGPVTTKAKGLGLGLAISKRIVEAHGGSIWLEKSPEHGTLVRVKLPIVLHTGGERDGK
ncbi:MAG TPA: PAS domain-containing protein, partial [Nitrososphaerales archaeon]|nr:PAS domain-containing protein [Nitrososphaerales archaeon]